MKTIEERLADIRHARIHRWITKLENLASQADDLELLLPNGGIVGSILQGIANDIAAHPNQKS